ncbi:MAG: hypothetical protein JSW64_04365 [Candidatus Zixiibacteriota bacterium]|nr:MAG: hypothetical protein JSW64_04365 [candidate division Zixibacteria bacterium]
MWQTDPNFNVVLIVALVFSAIIAVPILVGSLIYRNSQKRREAELIRLAIEKGQPVPNFPAVPVSRFGTLKAGLVWIAVGIGLILLVLFEEIFDWTGIAIGFIPLLVGIALIIGWVIEKNFNGEGQKGA